jgi:hypothetical protein
MPKFMLRGWAEQTLYDCRDYEVEAGTLEDAKELLGELQDEADYADCACASDPRVTAVDGWRVDGVVPLDPTEIVSGDSGIVEISEDGKPVKTDAPRTALTLILDDGEAQTLRYLLESALNSEMPEHWIANSRQMLRRLEGSQPVTLVPDPGDSSLIGFGSV